MKKKLLAGAVVLAAAIGSAWPAGAAIMQATYQGTIKTGYDNIGAWGTPGAVFEDVLATAVFQYDTTVGERQHNSSFDNLVGGSVLGEQTPIIDAWLEIGGNVVHFSGDNTGQAALFLTTGLFENEAAVNMPDGQIATLAALVKFTPPVTSLEDPFSVPVPPTPSARVDASYGDATDPFSKYSVAFKPTILSVTRLDLQSAAPEPGSWAFMTLGVGLAGAVLRRRRSGEHLALEA